MQKRKNVLEGTIVWLTVWQKQLHHQKWHSLLLPESFSWFCVRTLQWSRLFPTMMGEEMHKASEPDVSLSAQQPSQPDWRCVAMVNGIKAWVTFASLPTLWGRCQSWLSSLWLTLLAPLSCWRGNGKQLVGWEIMLQLLNWKSAACKQGKVNFGEPGRDPPPSKTSSDPVYPGG